MEVKIRISQNDLIESILESNRDLRPKDAREYIIKNLVMDKEGYIELNMTFETTTK